MSTDTHADHLQHPVVVKAREKRAADAQLRIADAITAVRRVDDVRLPPRRRLRRLDAVRRSPARGRR